MLETIGAVFGVLFLVSKLIGLIKSFIFIESYVAKLAKRPVSDREATVFDHVLSGHKDKLKYCETQACAGLA